MSVFVRGKGGGIDVVDPPTEKNARELFDTKIAKGDLVIVPDDQVESYEVQIAVDVKTSKPIVATRHRVIIAEGDPGSGAADDGKGPTVAELKATAKALGITGYGKWDAQRLTAEIAAAEATAAAAE